jgi:hypothetical protein
MVLKNFIPCKIGSNISRIPRSRGKSQFIFKKAFIQYLQRYSWHFYRVLSCVYPIVSCVHPIISFVYPIVSCVHPIISFVYPIVSCVYLIVSCIRFSVFYRVLRLSGFPSIMKIVYRVASESLWIVNNIFGKSPRFSESFFRFVEEAIFKNLSLFINGFTSHSRIFHL